MSTIQKILNDLLDAVATASIPIIAITIASFLKKYLETFSKKVTNDFSAQKVAEIQEIIQQVVAFVAQTYVDDLKINDEFSPEHHQIALNLAEEKAKSLLTKDSLLFILRYYKDIDVWLRTRIELEVRNISNAKKVNATTK